MGLLMLPALVLLTLLSAWAASLSPYWLIALVPLVLLLALGIHDVLQPRRSILRSFPVLGHVRFLMEYIRPEIQQYFIETNVGGRPFDRDTRTVVYERAKGIHGDQAFGTELEVEASGYEFLEHSMSPLQPTPEQPRVLVGGPDCKHPYEMALLNVSAMSFGALSANAILALNKGAKAGGFAHDTGEGGISPYHREGGADLVWEIGSGYFGARTPEGDFDPGTDIVKRIAQGADYTNSARAMMMAVGCIQAQKCHTNHCPVGVATQDSKRYRALDVPDKAVRVQRFQAATVAEAQQLIAAMGLHRPDELRPEMVQRRVSQRKTSSYAELYHYLKPGELLGEPVEGWDLDWRAADPDTFRAVEVKEG